MQNNGKWGKTRKRAKGGKITYHGELLLAWSWSWWRGRWFRWRCWLQLEEKEKEETCRGEREELVVVAPIAGKEMSFAGMLSRSLS
jgi:hypothetical protein